VTALRVRRTSATAAVQVGDAALVLLVASVLTYSLVLLAPGDAATTLAQQRAGPGATTQQVAQIREELGLDDTGPANYLRWVGDAVTGDLGISARTGQSIAGELAERVPVTLLLAGLAALVALPLGLAIGIAGALLPDGMTRGGLRGRALLGISLPEFWVSYLLIVILAEYLGLVPTSGRGGPETYVMPVAVLALPAAGLFSRVVAVTLREALDQHYVTAAKARGATPRAIVLREAMPRP